MNCEVLESWHTKWKVLYFNANFLMYQLTGTLLCVCVCVCVLCCVVLCVCVCVCCVVCKGVRAGRQRDVAGNFAADVTAYCRAVDLFAGTHAYIKL
jgi:hypothetical protein